MPFLFPSRGSRSLPGRRPAPTVLPAAIAAGRRATATKGAVAPAPLPVAPKKQPARVRVKPSGSVRPAEDIAIKGLDTAVQVRRHPAARRLTLRVSQVRREAVLTMPNGSHFQEAARFVAQHIEWLRQKLEAMPSPIPFSDGGVLLYRGTLHRVVFVGPSRRTKVVWVEGIRESQRLLKELVEKAPPSRKEKVRLPDKDLPRICVSGDFVHAPRRLRDWLEAQAKEVLSDRAHHYATLMKLKPKRVTIRDQVSRWGSCSSSKVLSFSWRLILAPPFVLDYVAAHEVAHLKEMNHGPKFWSLVRGNFPRMEEARRWLRKHGAELHRYDMTN
jgi:predicted metal-dependent hydrolase